MDVSVGVCLCFWVCECVCVFWNFLSFRKSSIFLRGVGRFAVAFN